MPNNDSDLYELYERDYTEEELFTDSYAEMAADKMMEYACDSGLLHKYAERLDALPKIIIPEQKAAYENLVPRLDEYAHMRGGKIRAEIDYKSWEARIKVWLPLFECCDNDDMQLLVDIGNKASGFLIESVGNENCADDKKAQNAEIDQDWVCVTVYFNYFQELISENKRQDLLDEILWNDEGIQTMLKEDASLGDDEMTETLLRSVDVMNQSGYAALKASPEFQDLLKILSPHHQEKLVWLIDQKIAEEEKRKQDNGLKQEDTINKNSEQQEEQKNDL